MRDHQRGPEPRLAAVRPRPEGRARDSRADPCLLLVHVASTKIPFTSEAKEAIAEDPEIDKEITLALQAAARHLRTHISRRTRRDLASEKFAIILKILPKLAEKTSAPRRTSPSPT